MTDSPAARAYKNFTPRLGIYRITHLPSGRSLIGWSLHLEGILNRSRFQLGLGGHPNKAMQRDWNADGQDAFRFEILDELKPSVPGDEPTEDLKELLALWQLQLALPPEQRY
ncbi:GIY-YIG nuclease family protein (plasmid) [Deinococcus sp. KNUC1210]|uniref:GIY-YIG nuclease family protein n=1 Tax=Deinococcus sp. KNUC1210 TaxID=2917691 RepID=UPI001EF14301|nr:GIY-YIG nuclease family protein [Deinococcus sp. KNUC1210]ULH17150.1 GIY-YIG nuclease family protein [Deinococcus sp. KNUC1210]